MKPRKPFLSLLAIAFSAPLIFQWLFVPDLPKIWEPSYYECSSE